VQIREPNEIGELGTAFNDMAAELAQTSARVHELHDREIERAGQLATVGELAAGVAHEIKNPLVGISGGLDLVMRHTQDDSKLRPIVDEIDRQVSRIDVAVKDLLQFARPATPNFAPADVNEIVERALTLVRPTADTAGVRIAVETGRLPRVLADEEMIRQSLVNLIMNSVQATEAGGRVRVITKPREDGVEIRISDTGTGIPPDQLSQIFRPFFTTKHQGTGLGLSITQSVIERHHGTLSVTQRSSTPGRRLAPRRRNRSYGEPANLRLRRRVAHTHVARGAPPGPRLRG
jgi:signal transduction histidine kinase